MKFQHLFRVPLVLSFMVSYGYADHISEPDYSKDHLKCDLECHNYGLCRFITEDHGLLQQRIQSGHMVHECICPMGFRGMSCDVNEAEHESCDTENTNKYGRSECDCVVADEMSIFAGEQCRKPYTEYGASLQQTIGGHISYCTNGGKLKGDMMAAKESPRNTTNNYLFQHAGCICPPEFTGEHCELLDYEGFDPAAHHRKNNTKQSANIGAFPGVLIGVGSLCVVLGIAMLYRKRREYRSRSVFSNNQGDTLALNTLPQPPPPPHEQQSTFYTENAYTDDEFVDPYNREASDSEEDGEFHDVLPEIL